MRGRLQCYMWGWDGWMVICLPFGANSKKNVPMLNTQPQNMRAPAAFDTWADLRGPHIDDGEAHNCGIGYNRGSAWL